MQVIQTLMKKKKGRDNIMHEVAILAIWFSFTIAGMILTILMPHIFPDSPGKNGEQDQLVRVSSEDGLQGHRIAIGRVRKAA
jgi:hypothetical protein